MSIHNTKNTKKRTSRRLPQLLRTTHMRIAILVLAFGGLGLLALQQSQATTYRAESEAEAGQIDGNAALTQEAGVAGVRFGAKDPNPLARNRVVTDLADPEVYKESDSLFFLSGTRQGQHEPFPIFKSTDLTTFTFMRNYNPSDKDPEHDYCHMWAPEMTKRASLYYFYFSAEVVDKGKPCPADDVEPTTFYATAADLTLDFGIPQYINKDDRSAPRTYPPLGCPDGDCDEAIRIDSSTFFDGTREWMHYVWFGGPGGLTISAFPLDDPGEQFRVSRPEAADEEGVNEAPALFAKDGKTYLFFSQGAFHSQYRMRYIVADSVKSLIRSSSNVRPYSDPLRAADGKLVENHGHNSIVERGGQYYTFYHIGMFDAAGAFTGARSTYVQPLHFKPDGTLYTLNSVNLEWPDVSGNKYSLDVQTFDGTWVTKCLDETVLDDKNTVTFNEVCKSANNRIVHKYDVKAFRVNYIDDGTVSKSAEKQFDGIADILTLQ